MHLRLAIFILLSTSLHASVLGYYGIKGSEVKIQRASGGASIEIGTQFSSAASVAEVVEKVDPPELEKPKEIVEIEKPVAPLKEALLPKPQPKKKIIKRKKKKKKKKRKVSKKNSVAQKKGSASRSKSRKKSKRAGAKGRQKRVSGKAAKSNYRGRVYARIRSRRFNPGGGRGTVIVRFTVRRGGGASAIRISRSSGNKKLDRAALSIVRRASPFPHFPTGLYAKSLSFSVPISFR